MGNKFISNLSKIIIIASIVVGVIFAFSIISNAENIEDKENKNEEQIRYLDTKLLTLINYLNNINLQNYKVVLTKVETESSSSSSSSKDEEEDNSESGTSSEEKELSKMEQETIITKEEQIDWETIEGELEILCSTWSTIVLDLYSTDVKSEDILNFSNNLDEAIVNVNNKEKSLSCMYLAKLYSYLPAFLNQNNDEIKLKTLQAKTYIVNAYAYAETENWEKIGVEVAKAENILVGLVNDARFVNDQRKYNINKSYILIEELKNSLITEDTGIFYIKYKNVLEELDVIT